MDVADFPFIQHIEITGIQTAIALHHQIASTGTECGAGTWGHPHQNTQIVVKSADADVVSSLPIPIPAVEKAAKKFSIGIRFQGVFFGAPLGFERIKAGNKLYWVVSKSAQ